MRSLTAPMLPIETVNWGNLMPTYPYRYNGPGYLYCVQCEHFIRLVIVSDKQVFCSDCTRVLAISLAHND